MTADVCNACHERQATLASTLETLEGNVKDSAIRATTETLANGTKGEGAAAEDRYGKASHTYSNGRRGFRRMATTIDAAKIVRNPGHIGQRPI